MTTNRVKVTYIYPTDPVGNKVGGVESFLKGSIKHAPPDFDIEFLGISTNLEKRPPRQWQTIDACDRKVMFYPVFYEKDENSKSVIPLALRFAIAIKCLKIHLTGRVLLLDRIEPIVAVKDSPCPKIGFIHSDIVKEIANKNGEVLWGKWPQLYFLFEKLIFPYFTHLYTVSTNSLNFYKKRYPHLQKKFTFLPTWADPDIFYPPKGPKQRIKAQLAQSNPRLKPESKWIISVGRIQKAKAPLRLIDSFLRYNEKYQHSTLLIIGEGNLQQRAMEYVKSKHMDHCVLFLGGIPQKELTKYYWAADLLALVSNYEGMPLCVLESLGCGTPVVTTNVGEVNRVVTNRFSGEIIDSFDPIDIAAGMEKIIGAPELYSVSNAVGAVKEFTPTRVLKVVYQRIRELHFEQMGMKY